MNATGRHAPGPMKNREEGMKKLPNAKLNAPKPKLHRVTGRIAEERVHVASEARQESIEDLLSTEPTTIAGMLPFSTMRTSLRVSRRTMTRKRVW